MPSKKHDAPSVPAAGITARDDAGGFDKVVERLRGVVEKLEAGNLGLEAALAAFEEGVRLSRRGAELLAGAERRVEMLTRGEGGERVVPFPGAPGEGDGGA